MNKSKLNKYCKNNNKLILNSIKDRFFLFFIIIAIGLSFLNISFLFLPVYYLLSMLLIQNIVWFNKKFETLITNWIESDKIKQQIDELNQKENNKLEYVQESTNYLNVDNNSFYYFNKNSKIREFSKFSKLIK
jgi:hypothetical protein